MAVAPLSLTVVVERPEPWLRLWWATDADADAPWIRLDHAASDDDIVRVLGVLAACNDADGPTPEASIARLRARDVLLLPGGLAAAIGDETIAPSCCCGLEQWRDWEDLLRGGESLWLGHDPTPTLERHGDRFVLWADVPDVHRPPLALHFDTTALATALACVEQDLRDFCTRMSEALSDRMPHIADDVTLLFRDTFVAVRATGP
jgi:hypothetical protein